MRKKELKEELEIFSAWNSELVRICQEYEDKMNKAIEYIESEYTITDDDVYLALYSSDGTLDKLVEILRGEE